MRPPAISWGARLRRLRGPDRLDDFVQRGVRPDLDVRHAAVRPQDVRFRDAADAESLRDARPEVRSVGVRDPEALEVGFRLRLGVDVVDAQEDYALILELLIGLFEFSGFLLARLAPRGPEVNQHHLSHHLGGVVLHPIEGA